MNHIVQSTSIKLPCCGLSVLLMPEVCNMIRSVQAYLIGKVQPLFSSRNNVRARFLHWVENCAHLGHTRLGCGH
jgi:hypothetical protein